MKLISVDADDIVLLQLSFSVYVLKGSDTWGQSRPCERHINVQLGFSQQKGYIQLELFKIRRRDTRRVKIYMQGQADDLCSVV